MKKEKPITHDLFGVDDCYFCIGTTKQNSPNKIIGHLIFSE